MLAMKEKEKKKKKKKKRKMTAAMPPSLGGALPYSAAVVLALSPNGFRSISRGSAQICWLRPPVPHLPQHGCRLWRQQ
jgi:hypothetical protein